MPLVHYISNFYIHGYNIKIFLRPVQFFFAVVHYAIFERMSNVSAVLSALFYFIYFYLCLYTYINATCFHHEFPPNISNTTLINGIILCIPFHSMKHRAVWVG